MRTKKNKKDFTIPSNNPKVISNAINKTDKGSRIDIPELSRQLEANYGKILALIQALVNLKLIERKRTHKKSSFYKIDNLSENDILDVLKLKGKWINRVEAKDKPTKSKLFSGFRFSDENYELIEGTRKALGLNKTEYITQAVEEFNEKHNEDV